MDPVIKTICQALGGNEKSYLRDDDGTTEVLSFKIPKCSLEEVNWVRGKYLPTIVRRRTSEEKNCEEWVFFAVKTFGETMELWETLSDGMAKYIETFSTQLLKTHCFFIVQRIESEKEIGIAVTKTPEGNMRVEINRFGKSLPRLN